MAKVVRNIVQVICSMQGAFTPKTIRDIAAEGEVVEMYDLNLGSPATDRANLRSDARNLNKDFNKSYRDIIA
jgi:hypothetical protein